MKLLKTLLLCAAASGTYAHEGHGVVGSIAHDMQHQLWIFAALVVVTALVLAGDRLVLLVRDTIATQLRRRRRD